MADQILNNTLAGTMTTPIQPALPPTPQGLQVPTIGGTDKTLNTDIQRLQVAQQQPNALMDFQKVMQLTSQQAYKDRQTSELKIEGQAFDPSKVSGGTFATIIGNLEAQRGADVGKIYASTLNAYASAQEQITNRLQFLQGLKQAKEQFNAELKLKKEAMANDKKLAKQDYKFKLQQLNQAQKQWEAEFALAKIKAQRVIDNQSGVPEWAQ